ncbi:MAG: bifunctional (p)ppGpp synthetase/guanosine-3',5'-bis(diphosphate) 3'-pyrophosphohydrolase [Pseudomonadota bacterium]
MIRQFELIERVRAYNPRTDEALLNAAYVFGASHHAGQTRASGEPYFNHPVEVAAILTELRLDDASIATALLHDTIEDTPATYDEVARLFGEEVAELVDGVTKLTKLQLGSAQSEQAENLRKLLLAMSKDVRVLMVKLADRLHNMRTLQHLPRPKQERKARETMEIFAPLAGRMGMQGMRDELEDLSFKILHPAARDSILKRFVKLKAETGDVTPKILQDLEDVLAEAGVTAEVSGREKRPVSIWRKLGEADGDFARLSDIYGFRVVTRSEGDCYAALGAVHRKWTAVPGRFKDYISNPKPNGYRSIHTTVQGRSARRVEIQIRTREMHEVAETGVAAHWAYKDGQRTENPFSVDPFKWLRALTQEFETAENPDEFLEHVKLEMFQDQVFCFTPKGRVVGLPRGATPIDFAYAIHTGIGNACVGAKIDGRRAPLSTRLRNGQTVEVITAEAQRPQPVWEEMAATGRAKQAIRRALRSERRQADIRIGRGLIASAFERAGKTVTRRAMGLAARKLGRTGAEDLLQAVGAAEIAASQVLASLYPSEASLPAPSAREGDGRPVVTGVSRARRVRMGDCCLPVPGDRIVGVAEKGKGVTVHSIDCPRLAAYEDRMQDWIDLRWDPETSAAQPHQTALAVTFAHERGALAAVAAVIADLNVDIADFRFIERKPDFYRARIDVDVRDVKQIAQVVTMLTAQPVVQEARRIVPAQEAAEPAPAPLTTGATVVAGGRPSRRSKTSASAAPTGAEPAQA